MNVLGIKITFLNFFWIDESIQFVEFAPIGRPFIEFLLFGWLYVVVRIVFDTFLNGLALFDLPYQFLSILFLCCGQYSLLRKFGEPRCPQRPPFDFAHRSNQRWIYEEKGLGDEGRSDREVQRISISPQWQVNTLVGLFKHVRGSTNRFSAKN